MTTAQAIQESLKTTVFGMGLVLLTLYILSLILDIMKVIFAPKTKAKKDENVAKSEEEILEETDAYAADAEDDTQLVAVITAAIAQYLQRPVSTIKVGTIRKIHEKTPIWGIESRIYNINNKL